MPKPFLITIQVEESQLGHVMRVLDRTEGVVTFDFDMDSRRAPPKRNGGGAPRKRGNRHSYDIPGHELFMRVLAKANKPMRSTQMDEAFAQAGRSPHSASAAHKLKQEGLIQTGDAGYVLTKKAKDRLRHRVNKEA